MCYICLLVYRKDPLYYINFLYLEFDHDIIYFHQIFVVLYFTKFGGPAPGELLFGRKFRARLPQLPTPNKIGDIK